jgi:hypothetical protein
MKRATSIALLMLLLPTVGLAKNKKPDVAAVFNNATYVYVEAEDGDVFKPGLYPADRQAIYDVEDALHRWKRYTLTTERNQAELVFVVRKGRLASGRLGGSLPIGQPLPPGQVPGRGQGSSGPGSTGPGSTGGGPGIAAGAEAGPEDDMLRVYMLNPDGKLMGPVWNRTLTDGLDGPQLVLFEQLKNAVERAYPQTSAGNQSKP